MQTTYTLTPCHVGTLPVPGWECFFGKHDLDFHDLYFYVWVVRGDGCVGLIDAGLPPDPEDLRALDAANQAVDKRCVFSDVRLLDDVFRTQGVQPDDVDFLLITQPITYHTGGLLPRSFPKARVYMSRAGVLEYLLDTPGHPPRPFYFTRSSWMFVRDLLIEERLSLVDDPTEVAAGITFETTGGHHPGSAGVKVATSVGVVGILETAFLQKNVDDAHPIGIAENAALCREVIRGYKRDCDLVLADHEPTIIELYPDGIR